MPTPMENLEQSYAKAEAAAAASIDAMERNSKKRLTSLLVLPPQDRFEHLNDPSLTPADTLELTRSLRAKTKPPRHKASSSNMARSFRRLSMRALLSPFTLLMLAMVAPYGFLVWSRTPRAVRVSEPVGVALQYPDGGRVNAVMEPGRIWWLVRSEGDRAVVRIWMPITGYQEFEVPESIVRPAI